MPPESFARFIALFMVPWLLPSHPCLQQCPALVAPQAHWLSLPQPLHALSSSIFQLLSGTRWHIGGDLDLVAVWHAHSKGTHICVLLLALTAKLSRWHALCVTFFLLKWGTSNNLSLVLFPPLFWLYKSKFYREASWRINSVGSGKKFTRREMPGQVIINGGL